MEANQPEQSNVELISWNALDIEKQTNILIEYGYYLDLLPPTCSIQTKNERFSKWLADKNIEYKV